VQSVSKAQSCLEVYRAACARAGRTDDWILRRYAWLGSDGRQVHEEVLPAYVGGLMEHWRESVEDDAEKELFARIDAGEEVSPEEIAADRLLWGDPNDVIGQVERYRETTGATHVHAAFGAGLPAHTGPSTLGDFTELRDMIRLFGREVISAFPQN
jgi:alkanesulfonate monooxygenase SsuD/methylene tetrahydromethanopterin reductase-like flavin-dependent oxidoreductase (luciferase family)